MMELGPLLFQSQGEGGKRRTADVFEVRRSVRNAQENGPHPKMLAIGFDSHDLLFVFR